MYRSHMLAVSFVALAAALCVPPAHAGHLDLNVNLASYHMEAWARDELNGFNPGRGLTYHWSRTWAAAAGAYKNSYNRITTYALGEWTPIQLGFDYGWHVDAGLSAGLASGYSRSEVASAPFIATGVLRFMAPNGFGLTLVAVPNAGADSSGFIGFQLSIRVR